MTVTYNHNRSLDERHKRYNELSRKQCTRKVAKYVVQCTRDAADGELDGFGSCHYFSNKRTAIAWAQYYSDIFDHVAGVFKMPEFICKVDVR